jgi:hypothetical protein
MYSDSKGKGHEYQFYCWWNKEDEGWQRDDKAENRELLAPRNQFRTQG